MFKKQQQQQQKPLVWQPQRKAHNKMAKLRWLGAYPQEAIDAPA